MDESRELYKSYFEEHGIPLAVADIISDLLTPSQTAALTSYKVWSFLIHY